MALLKVHSSEFGFDLEKTVFESDFFIWCGSIHSAGNLTKSLGWGRGEVLDPVLLDEAVSGI